MKGNTYKIVILGLFLAIAIILNIVENITVAISFIPGVKLGLANISIVFLLYFYGFKEMFATNVMRVIIASLISGTLFGMPFMISFASSIFCMIVIYPFFKTKLLSIYGLSMIQAVAFNFMQIVVVSLLYNSTIFFFYLPYLILSGIVTGYLIAFSASKIIRIFDKSISAHYKTTKLNLEN